MKILQIIILTLLSLPITSFADSCDTDKDGHLSGSEQYLCQNPEYDSSKPLVKGTQTQFSCQGKVYCSQMSSCEEAQFYQSNCSGTKMDGDNDGIPCEDQWCGH
jgi:hypothetical protein